MLAIDLSPALKANSRPSHQRESVEPGPETPRAIEGALRFQTRSIPTDLDGKRGTAKGQGLGGAGGVHWIRRLVGGERAIYIHYLADLAG